MNNCGRQFSELLKAHLICKNTTLMLTDSDWNAWKAQHSAQEMYDRIFNMKFLPPGRGLWAMGTPITEKKNLHAALNNCAFVSTEQIKSDFSKPFTFLMDASMLGVGVGFDTKGEQSIILKGPKSCSQRRGLSNTRHP